MSGGKETDPSGGESGNGDAAGGRIRALDERTVQRIAAGEVVERPASVVKELVENSLDAGASRVSVAVERGGTEGVCVRDDGHGMTEDDLRMAVREHTTSKISDIDDLEAGVGTLGFRGEALHTIGAVSRLTIRSKCDPDVGGGATAGTELRFEGGEVVEVGPAGCPTGTVVEVENLFYNTPARRKFLKTTATEFDHVNTVVTHYALANPDVAVTLEHDGREVFATEGHGSLESTMLSVYGREVAEAMVEVEYGGDAGEGGEGEADGDGPVASIRGLVSHPETNRSARDYLSTFVNGRYVRATALREPVLDAYGGQLAPDRYPFAVLFVDVPPETVDVNVHPRKYEIRLNDESGVRDAVEGAVGAALLDAGLVRSSAPRGRSAPDEATVLPDAGDGEAEERDGGSGRPDGDEIVGPDDRTDGPIAGSEDAAATSTNATSTNAIPSPTEAEAAASPTAEDRTASEASRATEDSPAEFPTADSPSPTTETSSRADASGDRRGDPEVEFDAVDDARSVASRGATRKSGSTAGSDAGGVTEDAGRSTGNDAGGEPGERAGSSTGNGTVRRPFDGPTEQRTLSGEEASVEPDFDRLPRMRVLGQLLDTYLVAETDDGLVLVDQHAADERVNYERLREEVAGDTPTQALASPVELELTAREAALFEEYRDALAQVGFHAGRTGERTVEVRTVPAVVDATLDPELLRDALAAFVRDRDGGRETVDAVAESLLADLACYPSITGNTSLREGSVVDLLEALDDCENPYACPHGRPVIIEFDRGEIEDRFERDYPGHAGRRRE